MSKIYGKGFHDGRNNGLIDGFFEGHQLAYDRNEKLSKELFDCRQTWINETIARHCKKILFSKKLKCLCPFHKEKTASCIFNPISQTFRCLSCKESGNSFKLAQKLA